MLSKRNRYITIALSLFIGGCSQVPSHPLYEQSKGRYQPTGYDSFAQYQQATRQWLTQNRVILNGDKTREIEMNMPFSIPPAVKDGRKKGILLVHGLGDSPWSFSDLAIAFSQRGYLVRTVLLPGHGTRPADMLDTDDKEWEALVAEQINILKQDVEEVSLGGFSTGANLVTSYAVQDPDIKNLYLFSPAFKSDEIYDFLTPVAALVKDWLFTPTPDEQTNIARYRTVPMNGFAQYYQTSVTVRDRLDKYKFDRPAFLVVSEADSVVDVAETRKIFERNFIHPYSKLLWFGNHPNSNDKRIVSLPSSVPEFKISNFSHMSVLYAPTNSYYGQQNGYRLCHNGPSEEERLLCRQGAPVWYSAWGYQEPDKIHARLTFNPYFDNMFSVIDKVRS